jgi:photosystem II stability/assembly factor-like uncharacterized protein
VALALFAGPRRARAVGYGSLAATVDLGGGMSVRREPRSCVTYAIAAPGCFVWHGAGLSLADPAGLAYANMFAPARGGRVVAATQSGVQFTDDRGAHWHAARWDSPQGPLSLSFDPRSDFGAAVGGGGMLWTTDDRGETWRLRRDSGGQTLLDVAVLGRTVVFSDARGGAWVSTDGGTSVRTLAESSAGAPPTLTRSAGAIAVSLDGRTGFRIDAGGGIERLESSADHH